MSVAFYIPSSASTAYNALYGYSAAFPVNGFLLKFAVRGLFNDFVSKAKTMYHQEKCEDNDKSTEDGLNLEGIY
jgi:hypothetical protein